MYICLHAQYCLLLTDFNETFQSSGQIFEKYPNIKFNENPSSDRRADLTKLIVAFHNFSNAPKNCEHVERKGGKNSGENSHNPSKSLAFCLHLCDFDTQRLIQTDRQLLLRLLFCVGVNIFLSYYETNFDIQRTDRASLYILIMKTNKMHYLSDLFDKVLYMFRTCPLSIISSISTLYTRNSYLSC